MIERLQQHAAPMVMAVMIPLTVAGRLDGSPGRCNEAILPPRPP